MQFTKDDELVHGAEKFAVILNMINENGEPDLARIYYALERGLIDASKMGNRWVSTRRRLLRPFVSPRHAA